MGVKVGVEIRNLPLVRSRSHACLAARRIAGLAGWNRGSLWRSLSSCCSCSPSSSLLIYGLKLRCFVLLSKFNRCLSLLG